MFFTLRHLIIPESYAESILLSFDVRLSPGGAFGSLQYVTKGADWFTNQPSIEALYKSEDLPRQRLAIVLIQMSRCSQHSLGAWLSASGPTISS